VSKQVQYPCERRLLCGRKKATSRTPDGKIPDELESLRREIQKIILAGFRSAYSRNSSWSFIAANWLTIKHPVRGKGDELFLVCENDQKEFGISRIHKCPSRRIMVHLSLSGVSLLLKLPFNRYLDSDSDPNLHSLPMRCMKIFFVCSNPSAWTSSITSFSDSTCLETMPYPVILA
jgi:hypothetical protein